MAIAGDVATKLHHRQTDLRRRSARRKRRPERNGHGVRNPSRPLPEELAALVAEDAAPHAVEIARNDGHVEPTSDALESPPEREQVCRPADLPFREDADDVTGFQLFSRPFERGN